MRATAICQRLSTLSQHQLRSGTVHSVFDHAVNLDMGENGLIGLIAQEKALTPYAVSVRMSTPFSQSGIRADMAAYLENGCVRIPEAGILIELESVPNVDLSVDSIELRSINEAAPLLEELILTALQETDLQTGLAPLATGAEGNVYSRFLAPRLEHLFLAMKRESPDEAAQAASHCAGCGMGLTPSSDDLLCGYFTTLHLLFRAKGRMRAKDIIAFAAQAAANRTNRISGTFLLHSGAALTNAAACDLYRSIFTDLNTIAAKNAVTRVREIGSTSGADMLTGILFALRQHFGGNDI